jgi:hypothetical protein
MDMMRMLARVTTLVWASPWTLLGMGVGAIGLLTGGRAQRRGSVVEFHGGAVTRLLARLPNRPMAMTLGHTIIGVSAAALDILRPHELVHVRQYERWGPAFVPAYLLCSARLWLAGKDAYRDNPFEQEAYRQT